MNTSDDKREPAVVLEHVYAGYSKDLDVLKDISIKVDVGGLNGLIGLNGAGKSTVMKTVMGFLRPRHGRVLLRGSDVTGIPPHECLGRGLYMLPQDSSLFPSLTVRENLNFMVKAKGGDLDYAMEQFPGLKEFLKKQAGDLSGGWQKMVEFAKAILARPDALMIDEPSIGLSPAFADEVYSWIARLRNEDSIGILLVDHNIEKVMELTDHAYILSLGSIVADGSTTDLSGNIRNNVREWMGLK